MEKPPAAASVVPGPAPAGKAPAPLVDVEAGVERLMGNRQVYLRALARFRHDYRSAGAAIGTALETGNPTLAQRLVHTLKGAAGMIEARSLHAAALALETALRTGGPDSISVADPAQVDALFVRLDAELAHVLRELDGMAGLAEAVVATPRPAPPINLLERLRALLDIGDGEAVDLAEQAQEELIVLLGESDYRSFSAAVGEFDFERALALLDRPERAGTAG
ncbi:Hpt domain-containing protein [Massilia brevitalea]|uniref:Hpt domain-containing protein n=1 Tax=Massilia brevitalea TaxID=442526 RepID=UPI0027396351|nr:Hpt domain-containing protein [Massilia brevitalea]